MEALARRHGVGYIRRTEHEGAKAGNINHALARTDAPYVVVFDCDHVPHPAFLERTLGYLRHPEVAFVQTPQYYANADQGGVAAASWAQQALFFGPIARAKDSLDSMFCCGTNVVFRRQTLEEAGGFHPIEGVQPGPAHAARRRARLPGASRSSSEPTARRNARICDRVTSNRAVTIVAALPRPWLQRPYPPSSQPREPQVSLEAAPGGGSTRERSPVDASPGGTRSSTVTTR
jgi:hypothetical protein